MPLFYSISRKRVGACAEVLVRFYISHINQRAHTGIYVPVAAWNEQEGRCNISRRYSTPESEQARTAQAELDDLAQTILNAYMRDKRGGIGADWLRGVVSGTNDMLPLYDQIEPYIAARNVAPATVAKMRSLGTHLRNFATARRKVLYKETLTQADLDAFAAFIRQGRGQNSVACRMRQLRTLCYWNGKPNPNPFDGYLMPSEVYADPIYLTAEERDYLATFADLSPHKQVQRDIFIFQCLVGCRVSDLLHLMPANISDGWLVYVPRKTTREDAHTIEVPLSDYALQLIERYRGVDVRGRLLPFITEQRYNETIKEICRAANLDRPVMVLDSRTMTTQPMPLYSQVTSHTARKTFAQAMYTKTGDRRLVASMTGHSENSQAFNRYSEISREMKRAAIQKK